MKKLLTEPLVHFILLGALIFAAYAWLAEDRPRADEIVVTRGQQEHLANVFTRTWQRPPTAAEFEGLIRDHIREEIAYREGQAMGLAENDMVIRRRVRQKLELLTDEIVELNEPTNAALQDFLEQNIESFRTEPRLDLKHVYLSRDRRGQAAGQDARQLLERLRSDPDADWAALGDPLPLGDFFNDVRAGELDRQFGEGFGGQILELEQGAWSGPVESAYGLHLVYVEDFVPARGPTLDEIHRQVRTEWFAQQREAATERLYERLAENYEIVIEPLTGPGVP